MQFTLHVCCQLALLCVGAKSSAWGLVHVLSHRDVHAQGLGTLWHVPVLLSKSWQMQKQNSADNALCTPAPQETINPETIYSSLKEDCLCDGAVSFLHPLSQLTPYFLNSSIENDDLKEGGIYA